MFASVCEPVPTTVPIAVFSRHVERQEVKVVSVTVSLSGCRQMTALVGLIRALLVGGVFCVTSGFVMFVTNTCVVFSTACAAVVF